jgi:hypothetical protein
MFKTLERHICAPGDKISRVEWLLKVLTNLKKKVEATTVMFGDLQIKGNYFI